MDLEPPFLFHRSPVFGLNGMVASSQPLATAAGLEILACGGNAADAAVATAAVLNVTEPTSTGLGGDMFALYYAAQFGKISALNGSGRSPTSLSLDTIKKNGMTELPPYHPFTITVPGACAGWCDLINCHGSLPLKTILARAIQLAEDGFPVEPVTSHFWKKAVERQLKTALNGLEMTIDGRGPNPGEMFRNPGLARSLRLIAERGKAVFYEGEIAEAIVSACQQAGGCLSMIDLAGHISTWDEPISTSRGGLRLWECSPNGQGMIALLALNILEDFSFRTSPLSSDRLHLEIEALRLAFADARWYVADPKMAHVPVKQLLSKEYAAERRKHINPKKATIDQRRGTPLASSDTVYFCVVDKWGNACSFTNSNYMGFGTGIVPRGLGFTLQNRGHNFSLQVDHPNVLAPGKRPYHTIIPAMITRDEDGSLFGAMGVMGGFMQPQGHLQVFLSLAQGLDPQSVLELPRFCISEDIAVGKVALEEGMPAEVIKELSKRGHSIRVVAGWERALFGRGQIIIRDSQTGVLAGGSDPRADGCAQPLL
jgi:gamma-glutamyltranspeptidase/glutathione hydrolase